MSKIEKQFSVEKELQLLKLYIEQAGKTFVEVWNNNNADDPIDMRFTISKAVSSVNKHAQISLQFELRRNLIWEVLSRTVANTATKKELEMNEVLLTTGLWRDMFVEITQIGFISAIGIAHERSLTRQPDHDQHRKYPATPDQAQAKGPTNKKPRKPHSKKNEVN